MFLFPFLSRTNNDLRNFNRNFNNLYESNHQKIINHRIKRRNNLSSALSKNKPLNSLLPSQYFIIQFKQYSGNATPTPYSLQDKVKLFELVSSTLGIKGIQIGSHFESLSSQTDNTNIIDLTIGSAFPSLLSPVSFKDQLLVSSRAKCAFINASGCESIFATMEIPYVYYGSWHLLMNCISSQAINVPTLIYNKHTNTFLNLKDQLFVHNSIADTSGHDPTLLDPHLHFLIPTLDEILEAYQLVTYGSEFLQKLKYDQELFLKNYLCDSDLSHSYSMGMPMLPSKFSILTSL
ncbi:hypothetical protein [Synechococcus sp. MIT S9451]|uniref:hypothetical protein n=1 Tax=Synechococcus sp. MIT S9451 TaxID=3082543 RepID=UPI0039B43B54